MKLPTPVGRQSEVLTMDHRSNIAVHGTAGSGKTVVVILKLGDFNE